MEQGYWNRTAPLLSPRTSVQLLPSKQTLGWLLLVPMRCLFIQSFKWN